MRRDITSVLQQWKNNNYNRKPLLLMGARQTGKSWILEDFGKNEFEHYIVIDFEKDSLAVRNIQKVIMEYGLDATLMLQAAGIDGQELRYDNTLIIFDEIQRNPRMFTALKYIQLEKPEAFVVASGSLMGLALKEGTHAPVGYVTTAHMLPMTFYEFLEAVGEKESLEMLQAGDWASYEQYTDILDRRLRQYIMIGGMPGPVSTFVNTDNTDLVRQEQKDLLHIYEQDFNVHAKDPELTEKIRHTWHIACQLATEQNENGIFFHKMPDKRASDYFAAVQWLEDCGLIHICRRCSEPVGIMAGHIDLKNYNSFKVYPLDVGLRMAECGYPMDFFEQSNSLSAGALRGKVVEQYVYQQLYAATSEQQTLSPAYYSWKRDNRKYEIDFMIPEGLETLPIEVKSASSFQNVSLKKYIEQFHAEKILRVAPRNPGIEPPVWSLPLAGVLSVYQFASLKEICDTRKEKRESNEDDDEDGPAPRLI